MQIFNILERQEVDHVPQNFVIEFSWIFSEEIVSFSINSQDSAQRIVTF